jgi:hypothetical protein
MDTSRIATVLDHWKGIVKKLCGESDVNPLHLHTFSAFLQEERIQNMSLVSMMHHQSYDKLT